MFPQMSHCPPSLAYGNIASNKNGKLYAGDSSNSPIGMLDERTYNQVGNPNLLDNSDFTNAVKQRGDTIFDRNGYCVDRWQVFESTYDTTTRTVTADDVVESYGSQFRQIIDPSVLCEGDTISVSAYVNNTLYKFTTTITTFSDSGLISDAPYALETSWGGFKIVLFSHRPEIFFVMFLNPSQKITVNWAKLERGASVTPYVPKGYWQELSECLRYYQTIAFSVGADRATYKYIPTLTPMRTTPTCTLQQIAASGTLPTISTNNLYITANLATPQYFDGIALLSADF